MARKAVRAESNKYLQSNPPSPPPANTQHPVFCLRHIVGQPDFSFDDRDQEQKAAFVDRLFRLSRLTWQQIQLAPRHGMGFEKIPQSQLTFPLPKHITDDITIYAFRLHGKSVMLGYRDYKTLHIIALDPNFEAYEH